MISKILMSSFGLAPILLSVSLVASAQYYPEPFVVLKDESGQVRSDSVSNLAKIRHISTYPKGVRIWVTFVAPYEPNLLPGSKEFRKQEEEIEKIRKRLIARLQALAPASRDYVLVTTGGPHFAVVTDSTGIDFLMSDREVTRIFGPV